MEKLAKKMQECEARIKSIAHALHNNVLPASVITPAEVSQWREDMRRQLEAQIAQGKRLIAKQAKLKAKGVNRKTALTVLPKTQAQNDREYHKRKRATSSRTPQQAAMIRSGSAYSRRKFDLIDELHVQMKNEADENGNRKFTREQQYQARKHKAKMIERETEFNGAMRPQLGNNLNSWNEDRKQGASGKQKTKGKSQQPAGWYTTSTMAGV